MERIKINSIEKKGVVCIVKYEKDFHGAIAQAEATLNVNFNAKEIAYLENEVGIGGTVEVLITNKEKVEGNPSAGFWVNITKVDFSSAKKNTATLGMGGSTITQSEKVENVPQCPANVPETGLMSAKDIMISSLALTKAWATINGFPSKPTEPAAVLDAYRFFVLELEQNG